MSTAADLAQQLPDAKVKVQAQAPSLAADVCFLTESYRQLYKLNVMTGELDDLFREAFFASLRIIAFEKGVEADMIAEAEAEKGEVEAEAVEAVKEES